MGWLRSLLRRPPLLHVAGDVGAGPVVVLLHGIASSSVTFENVVPLIVGRHRVVSIDLLGFGESPVPADAGYTLEEHVAALDRTLRRARLRRFVLVGHSMGALIGARYAATHSRQVTRLVLVSPPVYLSPAQLSGSLNQTAMGLYLALYEFLRANKQFTILAAAGLARLSPIKGLLDLSERNWRPFALSLEKAIESQTTVSDVAAVRVPIHLVYGTLDPFLHPAGLHLLAQLGNVTSHPVSGVDHVIRPRMARVVATAIG
ncbi:MAG: alpha/beta fold hydrolase [Pseudolysinimonas sp.]